jgi:hypothetical protein
MFQAPSVVAAALLLLSVHGFVRKDRSLLRGVVKYPAKGAHFCCCDATLETKKGGRMHCYMPEKNNKCKTSASGSSNIFPVEINEEPTANNCDKFGKQARLDANEHKSQCCVEIRTGGQHKRAPANGKCCEMGNDHFEIHNDVDAQNRECPGNPTWKDAKDSKCNMKK